MISRLAANGHLDRAIHTVSVTVKIAATLALALIMTIKAPLVLRPPAIGPAPPMLAQGAPMPERMATVEQRLAAIEAEVKEHEKQQADIHLQERLARIEQLQTALLWGLSPVALFLITHTLELIWKAMRKPATTQIVYAYPPPHYPSPPPMNGTPLVVVPQDQACD